MSKLKISFCSMLADFRKKIIFEDSVASPFCPTEKCSMSMNMSIEHWLNNTDKNRQIWRLKLNSAIAYLKIQFLPRSKHTPGLEKLTCHCRRHCEGKLFILRSVKDTHMQRMYNFFSLNFAVNIVGFQICKVKSEMKLIRNFNIFTVRV